MNTRVGIWACSVVLAGCFTGGGTDGSGVNSQGNGSGVPGGDPAGGAAGMGGPVAGGGAVPGVTPDEPIGSGGRASMDPATGVVTPSFCSLPPESGPCEAAIERWHYDASAGGCRTFTYGGCDGNENNFESSEDCKAKCAGDVAVQPPPDGEACAAFADASFSEKYCAEVCAGGAVSEIPPGCPIPACKCPDLPPVDDACAKGVPLDSSVMCEGTIAAKLCFEDAMLACICLGCADSCLLLESWPQVAQCQ